MISTENVSPVDLVDGQRDAVERDRALLRDEARERLRRAQASSAPCRSGLRARQLGEAVDMAADDMAAEFVANLERALEIDARALLPACRRWSRASVSAAASTANQVAVVGLPVSTTVRQTPEQAIEAPIAIVARS